MSDPDVVRQRTLLGWMFQPLSSEHRNRVKAYLMDGDPKHLAGTEYEEKRRRVVAELAPKKPLPAPAAPLTADELRKLVPGTAEITGPRVEVFDSESSQLFLVVDPEGRVAFHSKLPPDELVQLLHALIHDVVDNANRAADDTE